MADETGDVALWLETFRADGSELAFVRYFDGGECYEGWGCAVAGMQDGTLAIAEYSHCSCDGPAETMTVERGFASTEIARTRISAHLLEDLDKRGQLWTA